MSFILEFWDKLEEAWLFWTKKDSVSFSFFFRSRSTFLVKPNDPVIISGVIVDWRILAIWFFFSVWVFFLKHSLFTGQQGRGESISLTPLYHFYTLHRQFNISRAITAESSLLHIASSRTRPGNFWLPRASR